MPVTLTRLRTCRIGQFEQCRLQPYPLEFCPKSVSFHRTLEKEDVWKRKVQPSVQPRLAFCGIRRTVLSIWKLPYKISFGSSGYHVPQGRILKFRMEPSVSSHGLFVEMNTPLPVSSWPFHQRKAIGIGTKLVKSGPNESQVRCWRESRALFLLTAGSTGLTPQCRA